MALTAKQQAFVDAYDGKTHEAAAVADISESYARQLMMDGTKRYAEPSALAVQEAIRKRNKGKNDGVIADREERQEFWSRIMRGDLTDIVVLDGVELDCRESQLMVRMKASELLGKSELDFTEKGVDANTAIVVQINGVPAPQTPVEPLKAVAGTVEPPVAKEYDSTGDDDGQDSSRANERE